MWCAVHSCDDRNISAKTYCCNTTSVSLRETASPQGEAFDAHPTLVEPTHISALNDHLYEQFRIRLKSYKNFKLPVTRPGLPEAFFSGQQSRSIDVCKGGGTQCLPPGGRGTAKRWMRNGDTLPFAMRSIQTVQPFPMYLFNEMHTDSEHIAVPHPPQCAHWGTFPPGEGIAFRHPNQSPRQPYPLFPAGQGGAFPDHQIGLHIIIVVGRIG